MDADFKLQPVPRSQATNAYELLEEVIKAIEEEPRRYNQEDWIQRFSRNEVRYNLKKLPTCGTVACVAGWIAVLAKGRDTSYSAAEDTAITLLGVTADQAYQLFNGNALLLRWKSEHGNFYDMPSPRTPEYAALGVAHIRRFMAENEAQLRAKAVPRCGN